MYQRFLGQFSSKENPLQQSRVAQPNKMQGDAWWSLQQWHNSFHYDHIKWKHFPRYLPFVRGIHRSPVNSPRKGQWRGALMFSLICTEQTVEQTIKTLVIWDAIAQIMTSLYYWSNYEFCVNAPVVFLYFRFVTRLSPPFMMSCSMEYHVILNPVIMTTECKTYLWWHR